MDRHDLRDEAADDPGPLSGIDERFGFPGPESLDPDAELPPGTNLGPATIVGIIGAGGMGRVYEAVQEAPRRTVAVKVLRGGVPPGLVRRFEREAELLARLRHPGIAQIHTFGTFAADELRLPFYVMELVRDARPITRHAAVRGLTVRARIQLFREVCAAVAHGHGEGVVHRDLKPGNILVDGGGTPKVIDFGVARLVGEADTPGRAGPGLAAAGDATGVGDIVGTLRYMSPEQLLGGPGDVGPAGDVYALGLVLHELLAGTLPYDLAGRPPAEVTRLMADRSAPDTQAVARAVEPEAGRDDARAIAVVVARCLEKAPADRYAHAGELADELGRWLDGLPVVARPPTALESVRRFARRHRVATAAAAVAVVALVAALVTAGAATLHSERQRRLAEESRAAAAREAAEARSQLYLSNVLLAAEARDRDNLVEARERLAAARSLAGGAGAGEPIELRCLAASLDDASSVLGGGDGAVVAVAWSPDGTWVASGDWEGGVRIERRDGIVSDGVRRLTGHEGPVWAVAFSPDGCRVVSAGADGAVRVHDTADGRLVTTVTGHVGAVYAAAFAPDGRRLVTASRDGTARIWDTATWWETAVLAGHEGTVYAARFNPDGDSVATGGGDGTARLWDSGSGRETGRLEGHGQRVFAVAFSPDGAWLATASEDGSARVWDVESTCETARLDHPLRVNGVTFLGGSDTLATASGDGVLRCWDIARGVETGRLRGHAGAIWSIACCGCESTLATGAADGTTRIWHASGTAPNAVAAGGRVLCAAYAPDGGTVATGLDSGRVVLWDACTLRQTTVFEATEGRVHGVAFTADGRRMAAACDDGLVIVWDVATGDVDRGFDLHVRRVYAVDFSADGRLMVTAGEDRTARIWPIDGQASPPPPLKHPRRVFRAVFSPDATTIATACEDRVTRLWDVATGREIRRFEGHDAPVNWVAFSADGRRLATASSDGSVRVWNPADGSCSMQLAGPARQVWKVAFSPDGTRLAAASADGTAQIWDADSGRTALTLRGHADQVWAVAFAPDGRSLVTGSWDGTLRLWGVAPSELARWRTTAEP